VVMRAIGVCMRFSIVGQIEEDVDFKIKGRLC